MQQERGTIEGFFGKMYAGYKEGDQKERDEPPHQTVRDQYERNHRMSEGIEQFLKMAYRPQFSDHTSSLDPELASDIFRP